MNRAWDSRPWLARAVQATLVLVPVLLALAAAILTRALVGGPYPVRLVAVVGAAGVVAFVAERLGRRLLPLSALLRLSLVFPDHAPNRFAVALRAGSTRDLMTAVRSAPSTGAQEAALQTVELLGALARHDAPTRRHSERVRAYTDLIAEALELPEADRALLRWTSLLHDLGKVTVAPSVLGKPARLDAHEWQHMQGHPRAGAELAAGLRDYLGPWFDTIEQHHERWDGGGYPQGLTGEQICLGARIVAVADSFEVMTAGRAYRGGIASPEARAELVRCGGSQFDPEIVRAFLEISVGRVSHRGAVLAMAAAVPFAGEPHLGLHPHASLHPAAKAHLLAHPSGHDAGGALHHTGHEHAAASGASPDQR